jgi:hypothetical protein
MVKNMNATTNAAAIAMVMIPIVCPPRRGNRQRAGLRQWQLHGHGSARPPAGLWHAECRLRALPGAGREAGVSGGWMKGSNLLPYVLPNAVLIEILGLKLSANTLISLALQDAS